MQHFDGELEKLLRADVITRSTALLFATNAGNLQLQIADIPTDSGEPPDTISLR
jgi:twitching motility protein PilT